MTTLEKLFYLKEQGVSISHIAKIAKTTPQTVSLWMSGKKNISVHLENSLSCAVQQFVKDVNKVEE